MNKKGFTLVELLAVIVLLTMVGVFSVSVILEKNDEKRDQIDSATKELIITAAKNYVSKNSASFEPKSGNTYCLDLKEVLTKEEIENINANSNKEITLTNNKVKVTYSQNNINYDVVNDCQENVDTLPNAPVLASNMIAIKWDQNNNIVVADQNKYGDWYNYEEKRWANAIVVPKEKLAKYKSLQAGELILPFNEIDDNLIFMVWIPRYQYYKKDNGAEIKFVKGTSTTTTGSYKINQAFDGINGFWISKFEITTLNETLNPNINTIHSSYNQKTAKMSQSLLTTAIKNLYSSNYNFLKNEANVDMVSNKEWVAALYLGQSKYGVGNEKIYASDQYTGTIVNYEVKNLASTNKYNIKRLTYTLDYYANYTNEIYYSENSVFTSTTRNVTGVYGLSGGANEWVKTGTITSPSSDDLISPDVGSLINSSNCLSRGGDTTKNGAFTYEVAECSREYSSRIVVK